MKLTKKIVSLFMILTVLFGFSVVPTHAHEAVLEVDYDTCVPSPHQDGIDESWYVLDNGSVCRHISQEVTTIKYYFEETFENSTYTWTTDVSETVANEIKTAYANSMKKWNNVYFYSYDSSGNVIKNKIVNVVEGTITDHNLSIFPYPFPDWYAATGPVGDGETIEAGAITHKHYSEWNMYIYVKEFCESTSTAQYEGEDPAATVARLRERTGAHELGHILGLRDVDNFCGNSTQNGHHQEVLMGYGRPVADREKDITYKDIAGVAITRGFHTDEDHKWLLDRDYMGNDYKLKCSICNGVKFVASLGGYEYDFYGICNGNHVLSSGNMMAVASYGNQDYYKCRYCSYVAPFSALVLQDYIAYNISDTHHEYRNRVTGLAYEGTEEHTVTENGCICGYGHTHSYGNGIYKNHSTHLVRCECGETKTQTHYVRGSDIVNGRYATCLGCNRELDLWVDSADVGIYSIAKVSVNGSYILDNGIVVLVDADITAYLNGTLQFYEPDKLPSVA